MSAVSTHTQMARAAVALRPLQRVLRALDLTPERIETRTKYVPEFCNGQIWTTVHARVPLVNGLFLFLSVYYIDETRPTICAHTTTDQDPHFLRRDPAAEHILFQDHRISTYDMSASRLIPLLRAHLDRVCAPPADPDDFFFDDLDLPADADA